jgi:hypothetical protein
VSPATETLDRPRPSDTAARAVPWRKPTHTVLLQHDGLWDAGPAGTPLASSQWHESFEAWCSATGPVGCELLLSGTVVHDLVCDPGLPLASDAQLLDHGRAVFEHYHGEAAAHWRLAGWASGAQCGVSALHGADFAQLMAFAQLHGVRIRAMQPWWARVLALVHRRLPALRTTPVAWLIIVEAGFANALCLKQGQCAAVRAQWLDRPAAPSLAAFAAQLLASAGCADAVLLAMGYGLASGSVAGVEVLGRLDEVGPSPAWLLQRETRP